MKLEGVDSIELERAHRTGQPPDTTGTAAANPRRPRLIHCRLLRSGDRQHILKNAAKLLKNNKYKGKKI